MQGALDTEHLRSFIAVAETGGFTRAAARRHLSQSSVSAHIAALERNLGLGLVERRAGGAVLTEQGSRFLHRASSILALTDETLAEFRRGDDEDLVWGVTDFVVTDFPPDALAELARVVEANRVRLELGKSHELQDGVVDGRVDAVLTLTFEPPNGASLIGSVPLLWLESDARPLYRRPGEPVPLVVKPVTSPLRQRAAAVLASAGLPTRITAEASSVHAMLAAARLGLGVTALPTLAGPPPGFRLVRGLPQLGDAGLWFRAGARLSARQSAELRGLAERGFAQAVQKASAPDRNTA